MQVWGASAPGQTLPAGLGGCGPGPNPAVARAAAASGMCCGSSPAEAVLCTRSLTGGSLAAVLSLREGRPALHAVRSALRCRNLSTSAFTVPTSLALDRFSIFDVQSYGQMLLSAGAWTKDTHP